MAGVRLRGVRKIYPGSAGHVAVDDIDLEIADGEFVVLVGPSGSGKSTVLRMIAGLEAVSGGDIWIGDRRVNDVAPRDRDIAMVFQSYALYPHMTVFRNMAFALELRRVSRAEIEQRVREAAALFGIEPLLDRYPRQLSGGQRQRVAVGRAIVRQPKAFLFDEPLSNLDAALRVQLRRELSALHRRLQATMVYVTHDQVEAMTLGDRIAVLADGRIQQVDAPLALYDTPRNRFVAQFIGSPAMNVMMARLVREPELRVRSESGAMSIAVPSPWKEAVVGIAEGDILLGVRPEDVHLAPVPDRADARARVAPRELPRVGDEVGLAFDARRLHFFDANTGERLS